MTKTFLDYLPRVQLTTDRGNPAKNQHVVIAYGKAIFYSYDVMVATIDLVDGSTRLIGDIWDSSVTTRKYFWKFCYKYKSDLRDYTTQELRVVESAHYDDDTDGLWDGERMEDYYPIR